MRTIRGEASLRHFMLTADLVRPEEPNRPAGRQRQQLVVLSAAVNRQPETLTLRGRISDRLHPPSIASRCR